MNKIYYAKANYGKEEIFAVNKVLKNSRLNLVDSKNVESFEKLVCKKFNKKYGLMVNSGSSANLLALASLNLKKGSEVITPTCTFSTTVAPILQLGLTPKFVDVSLKTLQILDNFENSITKKTKVVMVPNLIGNMPNWKKIHKIARKYNLITIEDSADTIGYRYKKNLKKNFSDISTTSFFASHIVTCMGNGGMVMFNNKSIYEKAKLLRGWGRKSSIKNESESIKDRFNFKLAGKDYDSKYIFDEAGYNFLPSEAGAAFGLIQLKRLDNNIKKRLRNKTILDSFFKRENKFFRIVENNNDYISPWLAYPVLIKKNKKFNRKKLQVYLEKNNIQTRTIFTGNILKHPICKKFSKEYSKKFRNSDYIFENGILLGIHNSMKI